MLATRSTNRVATGAARITVRCANLRPTRLNASSDVAVASPAVSVDEQASNVTTVTAETYHGFVEEGVTIVDHYTQWCGPCKLIAPHYEEMAASSDFAGRIKFAKIDCGAAQKFAIGLGIKALPTFILYVNGAKKGEFVGAKKDKLRAFLLAELQNMEA